MQSKSQTRQRTSDSLNEGLPIKWPEKSFKENDSFYIKKILGSTLSLSAKVFFSLDKYLSKIWWAGILKAELLL